MRTLVTAIALLLLSQSGWACESYEECMQYTNIEGTMIFSGRKVEQKYVDEAKKSSKFGREYFLLKSIAYKLDEISTKLNEGGCK